jgi:hypothetical protein
MSKRTAAVRVTTRPAIHPWCRSADHASAECHQCVGLHAKYPFRKGETVADATARYFPKQTERSVQPEPEPQLVMVKPGRKIEREEAAPPKERYKPETYKIPLHRRSSEPMAWESDIHQILASERAIQESYNSLDKYLRMHRPCRDDGLAPNHGSELHKLWQKGHLSKQQLYGWQMFYDDLKRAQGSSMSLISSMSGGGSEGNYASRELQKSRPGHSSYWNKQAARLEDILGNLHDHERGLLVQLVRDALRSEGHKEIHAHTLAYLGSIMTGYRDNRQAIAGAVARVQALLTSLAESYGVQPFDS